jgi:acetyl esterase/lipase
MKAIRLILLSTLASLTVLANEEIPLWPNGAPGALGKEPKDIPTLTIYLPKDQSPTAAMVVCPGGGYGGLAAHEGKDYALWLNEQGIAAFVLKYRLGSSGYHHPAMLQDAARALRTVRARANDWNVDPKRVGIIGSSAGGHLTSTLLTHFDAGDDKASDPIDRVSSRPDLGVCCYPVITMDGVSTHSGSRKNLLGENPSPELVKELSSQLHVTKETPPTFIWHTAEDKGVLVENSLMFGEAFAKAGVPFELHIYQKGPHGMGLGSRNYDPTKWHRWTRDCNAWLVEHGFARLEPKQVHAIITRPAFQSRPVPPQPKQAFEPIVVPAGSKP